jgi:lipopolysaccharide export LptBFGC system permease protein LptF
MKNKYLLKVKKIGLLTLSTKLFYPLTFLNYLKASKVFIVLSLSTFAFTLSFSLVSFANEKLDQVHLNAKNSQHNLEFWKRNRETAKDNVTSIESTLNQNRDLQKKWKIHFDEIKQQIASFESAEKDFEIKKNEELSLIQEEQKIIQDLEKTLTQLKAQHEKRKENLASSKKVQDSFLQSKEELKASYQEQLKVRDALVTQEQELVKDGNSWSKKKQESQSHVTKWEKMNDYYLKIKTNYDRLSEKK